MMGATYARNIMGQESKEELQKILQLLEDVVRDAEAEIQRLQGLTEQEELYLDPEGTLSQALKRRIGAQHTIAELRQELRISIQGKSPLDGSIDLK